MLINVLEGEECRIALFENGSLEELYIERSGGEQHVGDIYKAVVTNVEPSIQAAFVDFGGERNGFLHVSDVIPSAYTAGQKRKRGRRHPLVQDVLKRGQHVVVQITREGIGKKGPSVTTYLSLPGKYLVLMPGIKRRGVSRKIEDEAERERLRQMLTEFELDKSLGFIVRTAGVGRTKRDLQRDLAYLLRLWKTLEGRIKKSEAPVLIYQESDLVIRTIRDIYTTDITRVLVDDENAWKKVRDFLKIVLPRACKKVKFYTEKEPLFSKYGVEEEIERIYDRVVPLPEGGSLAVDITEAIVAIDVNSGSYRRERDPEKAALQVNLAAAREVVRQLRLRDLGGLLIIDFIDMDSEDNRRKVERELAEGLKRDRARTRMLRMSRFGIVEMTRQRMRSGLQRHHYEECPVCHGMGHVKTLESMCLVVLRRICSALSRDGVARIETHVNARVEVELQNRMRTRLAALEEKSGTRICIFGEEALGVEESEINSFNAQGNKLKSTGK
ncbi:MAG TPA: Rne/Rng family ribonuclease, partial [Planctomycetota bacterium]|nr:Rne/Rng family ribonuclease [Planctomycetota bacterium]